MIKMFDLGVRGRMFNWIKDFLMNRTIQVMVGGVSSKSVEIENGTPQGSVISPVLFNIMINDIFCKVEGAFGLSLFADDGAIWKRGRNVEFILKHIQRALVSVEEWGNTWSKYLPRSLNIWYLALRGRCLILRCICMGLHWRR